MAHARPAPRFIVIAAGCWLALTVAACGQRTPVDGADPAAGAAPAATTADDAQALARALAPRMAAPAGGWKAVPDARGQLMIKTGGTLQNVTIVGRGKGGQLVSGCVSSPEQVTALLGAGRGR